jgi:WD40 repeat protein
MDNKAVIWRISTFTRMFVLNGHTNAIWYVSISSDSTKIATCGADKTIIIWSSIGT